MFSEPDIRSLAATDGEDLHKQEAITQQIAKNAAEKKHEMPPRCCGLAKQEVMTNQPNILVPVFVSGSLPPTQKKTCVKEDCPHFDCYPVEMKLFCRYIGGLSAGHVSYSLGRLKYIAIYRIHSAGSNIYRNISDAIDFKSNNNFHRLSIIASNHQPTSEL